MAVRRPHARTLVALLVTLLGSAAAAAQDVDAEWSIDRYGALSASMAAADAVLSEVEPGSDAYVEAQRAALAARQDVLRYLDAVIDAGNLPPEFAPPAERARFLLIQNVIGLNADLGVCDGIETQLARLEPIAASEDPELALAWDRAREAVARCAPESAVAADTAIDEPPGAVDAVDPYAWSLDRYGSLSAAMNAADDAILRHAVGSPERQQAREEALVARRAVLDYVSGVMAAGNMPPEIAPAAERARFLLIQNIIGLRADLDDCAAIDEMLALLDPIADSPDEELRIAYERAVESVDSCRVEEPAVIATVPPTTETEATADPAVVGTPPPAPRVGLRGPILTGAGAALVVGGLAWDIASAAGPRAEFTDLYDACVAGTPSCDRARLETLQGTINGARVPVAALVGAGAVVGVVGASLWVVDARRAGRARGELSAHPGAAGSIAGATLRLGW
jgi:hypothetical protein